MTAKPMLKTRALAGASALAVGWAMAAAASALPVNPTIFANSPIPGPAATFTPSTGTLTVTQNAERVVIDWDSFNIANGETVNFVQGQDNFIAFNRIDPSSFTTIDGTLTGNGSVWLFSPGGILFGANAQVNVGSFFAGLGTMYDGEATADVVTTDQSVFVGFSPTANTNTLTVAAGAEITAADFLILQGAQVDMNGDLVSDGGVGFINAEGANVGFDSSSPSAIALTSLSAAWDPAGRGQPYFNHGGTTTAAWVDLQYGQMFEADYEQIINLDGVITANGPAMTIANRPANTAIFVGGINSVTGLGGGRTVTLNVNGQLTTTAGAMNLQATDAVFTGNAVIDSSGDFATFTYGDITVDGEIYSNASVTIHSQAEHANILVSDTGSVVADGGAIDISGNRDYAYVEVQGELIASNVVRVRSKGDVYIGSTAAITGNSDDSPGNYFGILVQAGLGFDFDAQTMTAIGSGDVTIASGAVLDASGPTNPNRVFVGANYGDIDMAGTIYGSRITLGGNGNIVMSGELVGTDLVQVVANSGDFPQPNGGDILITGSITAGDLVNISAPNGEVTIGGGAVIIADSDSTPTTDVFGYSTPDDLYVNGQTIDIYGGAVLVTGSIGDPTGTIFLDAYGADQFKAAIDISGHLYGQVIDIESNGGSLRLTSNGLLAADGDVLIDTAEDLTIGGTIEAGDQLYAHSYGDIDLYGAVTTVNQAILAAYEAGAQIYVTGSIDAGQQISIAGLDPDSTVHIDGTLTSDAAVTVRAGGDVIIGPDAILTGNASGNLSASAFSVVVTAGLATDTDTSTTYASAGDLTIADGAVISGEGSAGTIVSLIANHGTLESYGDISGSQINIRANDGIELGGSVTATDSINVLAWTTAVPTDFGDIDIADGAVLTTPDRVLIITQGGDVDIGDGVSISSDTDHAPTPGITNANTPDLVTISASGHVWIGDASIDSGADKLSLYAGGVDVSGDAAMLIGGSLSGDLVYLTAYNGSIAVSGEVHGDESVDVDTHAGFILTSSGVLSSDHVGNEPFSQYLGADDFAGVFISAADVAIAGEVDSQIIAVRSVNGLNTVIGGADGTPNVGAYELGGEFNLSNAEFQHLNAGTIVIMSGTDNSSPVALPDTGMTVQDLTIAATVTDLAFGASTEDHINIIGTLTPQGPDTNLWVGFIANDDTFPGLTGAIPGQVNINGFIGTPANPFAGVHLLATDSILMGSSDFIGAALADPDFDAEADGHGLTVNQGQVFIAADVLTLAAGVRIVQQNTAAGDAFGGLLVGEPQPGMELIWIDPELDGAVIAGSEGYTIDTGPDRIQLYGAFLGESGEITGRDVAENPYLLTPLLPENVGYSINGCQFGGGACGGDEVPQFQTPTDTGAEDLAAIDESDDPLTDEQASDEDDSSEEQAETEDQDSKLFRALVAPGADRAYEQERIGEPITGSGNEDLWTGRGDGDRP